MIMSRHYNAVRSYILLKANKPMKMWHISNILERQEQNKIALTNKLRGD
jgi:hypothetical protein